MAKLTWLGSEDYREGESPLESITWCGVLFTAGDKVEVTDEWMIAKARGNRFFKVEDDDGINTPLNPTQWREPETEADPADVSFFDDPPGVETPLDYPPDYPPEEEPKRKRGRPRKVIADGNRQ
jgi:hypothetical protein